jgi:hypothetical protein
MSAEITFNAKEGGADLAKAGAAEAPKTILQTVKLLRGKLGNALATGELKGTLADYIKLIQLEKELGDEQPREIKVGWVQSEEEAAAFRARYEKNDGPQAR